MVSRTSAPPADGTFESPFKPPAGLPDFLADAERHDGAAPFPYATVLAGIKVRYRTPPPGAMAMFVTALSQFNTNADIRAQQRMRFIAANVHPADLTVLVRELVDPDQPLGDTELEKLMETLAKAGTARPIGPSSRWRRRR
jgi:hypothetical protein